MESYAKKIVTEDILNNDINNVSKQEIEQMDTNELINYAYSHSKNNENVVVS